jgi:DNA-binding NarL/FixJ family response regulator
VSVYIGDTPLKSKVTTGSGRLRPSQLTVLVAGPVRLYNENLAHSLGRRGFVAASAANASEALTLAGELVPDFIAIDCAMGGGPDLIRDLRAQLEQVKVLATAVTAESVAISNYAEAGVTGYVTIDASLDDFVETIHRMSQGEFVCPAPLAAALFKRLAQAPGPVGTRARDRLTARETEVLDLISKGHSNKSIASALNISESTVKNHVHHVLDKLSVATRAQAVAQQLRTD